MRRREIDGGKGEKGKREIDGRGREGGRNGRREIEIEREIYTYIGREREERDKRECEKERFTEGKRNRDIGNRDIQREEDSWR